MRAHLKWFAHGVDWVVVAFWLTFYYALLLPSPYDCQCDALFQVSHEHIMAFQWISDTFDWTLPIVAYWTVMRTFWCWSYLSQGCFLKVLLVIKGLWLLWVTIMRGSFNFIDHPLSTLSGCEWIAFGGLVLWLPAVFLTLYLRRRRMRALEMAGGGVADATQVSQGIAE